MPPARSREQSLHDFGDYELLEELGRGGQGVVYRARQKSLHRIVALKVMNFGQWATEAHVKRFRLEAEAAASLDHSRIVPIYEIGERDGFCYFSMKLVQGGRLDQMLHGKPMVARAAAKMMASLARTVHYAHQRGVLHRDIKPGNILLDESGEPHLTDFGLAKLVMGDSTVTGTTDVLGTPAYMAPEQASGQTKKLTTVADVYSLGALFYHMLTGQPPFAEATVLATIRRVLECEPRRPSMIDSHVNRDLETICLKCLAKEPEKRYASAEALADDLQRYLDDEPIQARQASGREKFWRWCRRNQALAGVGAIALGLLLALAIGSTVAAFRIQREIRRASQAEREAKEKLWASYLAQARATRLSGLAGRRNEGLAAVAAASEMKPSLELRNEAIACLALTDIDHPVLWRESPPGTRFDRVVFTPDFERYAVFHESGRAVIHRRADGGIVTEFSTPPHRGVIVEFSPGGGFIAGNFGTGRVIVWDVKHLDAPRTNFPAVGAGAHAVTFTADERLMALAGTDGQVRIYELASAREVQSMWVNGTAFGLGFNRLDQVLAVMIGGEVQLWNVAQGQRIKTLSHRAPGGSLAWDPQGSHLAVGYQNGDLLLWDTRTGEGRASPGHIAYVSGLAFNPQGEFFASQSWDGSTRLWDAFTGRHLLSTMHAVAVQFRPDGRQLSFFREMGSLGTWDVVRSVSYRTLSGSGRSHSQRSCTGFTADARWLIIGDAGGWHLLDVATGMEVAEAALGERAWPLIHPDGRSVIAVTTEGIMRWPLGLADPMRAVSVGPAETLLSAAGSELQRACLSVDGTLLAVVGHNQNLLIDLANPTNQIQFSKGMRQSYVALSPDRRWVATAAYHGSGVNIWDAQTGKRIQQVITNENAQISFSADGRTLVTATAREYALWDTRTWQAQRRVLLHLPGEVGVAVASSPDGRLFAIAVDRQRIQLLDLQTGREMATLTPPLLQKLEPLVFSADGRFLAAGTADRGIHLWDLRTLRQELATLRLDW